MHTHTYINTDTYIHIHATHTCTYIHQYTLKTNILHKLSLITPTAIHQGAIGQKSNPIVNNV